MVPAGRWRQEGQHYLGESRTGWQLADMGVGADDVLVLQFAQTVETPPAPSVGLYMDRGQVDVTDLAVYALGA